MKQDFSLPAPERSAMRIADLLKDEITTEGAWVAVVDLLTDLRHYADKLELDWWEMSSVSRGHYAYEIGGEES